MNPIKQKIVETNYTRFDNYIEKADNKASFLLALNGAILIGIILSSNNQVIKKFILSIIILIVSMIIDFIVIIPRKSKKEFKSCFYYEYVKKLDINSYRGSINSIDSEEKLIEEFLKESREIAIICSKKMYWVFISGILSALGIIVTGIISII